ncbi:TonB-dependent receptor [uncultured Mucilaginibacter sp.]|uniref:TonB-dependent receptor n=1 Tax=uncultured Mucilaginibacter sp. TaxID=797541 RepID=UPI0025E5AF0E|nr:TonB-dependent receptor [uncultured Mucilaginibacter sp.]
MKEIFTFIFLLSLAPVYAQNRPDSSNTDTSKKLTQVTVRGYLSERPLLNTPASVGVLSAQQLHLQTDNSLVNAMNTVPGVRMEERSPGSYRLSIRGSLLRSPFGVRDVKIYFDEMPLTDAGGNTYLNAIDFNSVQGVEILKGPDGSLFGANSGGVVLLSPVNKYSTGDFASGGVDFGSNQLVHENTAFQQQRGNNQLNINQAYESYSGYRQNSSMQRNFFMVDDQLRYGDANKIKAIGFYSDLYYQTPGGLTLAQMMADPSQARLATPTIASAQALNAHIESKMIYGGLVNEAKFSDNLRNVLTVFGTHVDFLNPSFTVYEQRAESTLGFRTYFELSAKKADPLHWKLNLGFEWEQTNSTIGDYGNHLGNKDTTQTRDNINTNQNFVFTRFTANLNKQLLLEAALSLNKYSYQFENLYPLNQTAFANRPFDAQLMPRLALAYSITNNFVWRASLSRGYSAPATGEIHPTDHSINTTLQAEDGWNYETGFRLQNANESAFLDASVFYYDLNNTIVPRQNPNGTTYYVNAGGTNQPGFELYFTDWLIGQNSTGFVRGLQLNESYTYSAFTFRDYGDGVNNYSGNNLTGVPRQVAVTSFNLLLPQQLYFFIQHNFTDKLPLNDANTVYASSYNLLEIKLGWKHTLNTKTRIEIFAGGDNLLNQQYSLGNDINAAASRYYNPAPLRNYFAGMSVRF